jgi:dimethylargininase
MFTKAIIRQPSPNFSEGLTTAGLGAPNYERALAQHEAYCAALEHSGLTLIRLEADPEFPDSTFVEDTTVLARAKIPDGRHDDADAQTHPPTQVVLTRPGAPSRAGEVESMRRVLVEHFPSFHSIQLPGTLDGGDVCEAGDRFFIGISERTNEAGARQLATILASFSYTTSFIDIRRRGVKQSVPGAIATGSSSEILHLKSGLAYLGNNRLALIGSLADRPEFRGYALVKVDTDEEYAANCVRVNEHVLLAAGYPKLAGELKALGYQTLAIDMTEFQKMDGGLSCLSLRF